MSEIGPRLHGLVQIGSAPIQDQSGALEATLEELGEAPELLDLLRARNGFYAFESALHVRGLGAREGDVRSWNRNSLWKDRFGGLASGLTFFAEDIFGGQFALAGSDVVSFDPETAERVTLANSLEAWADEILANYSFLAGYPLAHDWQQAHGPIAAGYRLVPKVPFVLGGEYSVSNLIPMRDYEAMRVRGAIATQINGAADGTSVRIET